MRASTARAWTAGVGLRRGWEGLGPAVTGECVGRWWHRPARFNCKRWIAASLQVYLRDTAQVVTVFMTLWFWITPIMMPESRFPVGKYPRAVTILLTANPLVYIVRVYRQMLLGTAIPWTDLLSAAGFAVATFVIGGLFFRHLKRGFADVL